MRNGQAFEGKCLPPTPHGSYAVGCCWFLHKAPCKILLYQNPKVWVPFQRLSVGSLYQTPSTPKCWKMMDLSVGLYTASLLVCGAAGTPAPLSRSIFWTILSTEILQCCKNCGKETLVRL